MGRIACLALFASFACTARSAAENSNATPPVFGEREGVGGQTCSRLVDDPFEAFDARVTLQLPVGVVLRREAGDRYGTNDVVASCAGGRVITRVELREVVDDRAQPLARVREQLLDVLELPQQREVEILAHDEQTRHTRMVVHLHDEGRRRSVELGLQGGGARLYVVVFECLGPDFEALRPSFEAALGSVVIAAPQR